MNAIVKAVKKYFTRKLGYRMYVQGGIFDGQSHYSMSFEECIDWGVQGYAEICGSYGRWFGDEALAPFEGSQP